MTTLLGAITLRSPVRSDLETKTRGEHYNEAGAGPETRTRGESVFEHRLQARYSPSELDNH